MKHTIGIVVSAFAIGAAGCGGPTEPDSVPSFTGIWIGTSRVISCEPSGGCVNYPVGQERYLNFGLTQSGDDVTGNLSPVKGGPLVLPPAFGIAGRVESGKLAFQSLDIPGVSGGLTPYSGEVTLASPAFSRMVGRMTERTGNPLGEPITILWAVNTERQTEL